MNLINEGELHEMKDAYIGELHSQTLDDGWTAITLDGALSAQFEHTIYVGARGAEILTDGSPRFMDQLQELGMKASPSALP